MSNLYKDAPVVKVVMLKGKDGAKSKLSELTNDMTFLTEEQIITLVNNIIDTGSVGDIDTGFVTRLVEQNKGKALKFWIGTQAEYNALTTKTANTFYIITDDSFKADVQAAINDLQAQINAIIQTDYETEISALQETTAELEQTAATLAAAIEEIENRPSNVYKLGDVENFVLRTAGYVTGNGSEVYFNIPLPKFLDYVHHRLELFPEAQITMCLRQKGHYFYGSSSGLDIVAPQRITLAMGGVSFSGEKGYQNSIFVKFSNGAPLTATDTHEGEPTITIDNNAPVGVAFEMQDVKIVEV